jgi:hypothetical protein
MDLNRSENSHRNSGRGKGEEPVPYESVQQFHRRISTVIEAVQAGIWQAGVHQVLGYATDFGFGRERGVQTLVLKTNHKSAYLRFAWDTVLSGSEADGRIIDEAIRSAIGELS